MSAIRDLIWDAIRQADHMLLTLCVAANLYGIALIYSATRWKVAFHSFPLKQGVAMLIGIGLYFVVSQFNIHLLMDKWRWVVLGCTLFLLLLRTPLGTEILGQPGLAPHSRHSLQHSACGNCKALLHHAAGPAADPV